MMRRTRVKICGITRLQDALKAQQLGVDSLGFVFVPGSSRQVSVESAASIVNRLSPFVSCVGLFLNATVDEVQDTLRVMPGLVPQFHGQETAEYCDQFARPYVKAIGVAGGMPSAASLAQYQNAGGFLFDSNEPGKMGGTGHAFNWSLLDGETGQKNISDRLILAGGLDVSNVQEAIRQVKPPAVDVSSGVESAKGIKDVAAMKAFMEAVQQADRQLVTDHATPGRSIPNAAT